MKTFVTCIIFFFSPILLKAQQPKLMLPIGHTDEVYTAVFSPDGKKILTGSRDNTAKIWDAVTGHLLADLKGHSDVVMNAEFSSDGKRIITNDGIVKLWDAGSGKLLSKLNDVDEDNRSFRFSKDGKRIVTNGNAVKIWNAVTGKLLGSIKEVDCEFVEFSPDGKRILTSGGVGGSGKIWETDSKKLVFNLNGKTGHIISAHFSPDGKKIITFSDSTVRIWVMSPGIMEIDSIAHPETVESARFSPDGKTILTTTSDYTAWVWNEKGNFQFNIKGSGEETGYSDITCFSPDGKNIIGPSDSVNFSVKVWDLAAKKDIAVLSGHKNWILYASFSPDGKKIVTASKDNIAKVWDVSSGKLLLDLKGQNSFYNSAYFSTDGKKIVTTGEDSSARVWDAYSGNELLNVKSHSGKLNEARLNRQGNKLVTASDDSIAMIWDAVTGECITDLKGHTGAVISAAFSPKGEKIITSSEDSTGKIWDAVTGKCLANLKGHTDIVTTASFSPDGKIILTASPEESAKIWDGITGKYFHDLGEVDDPVYTAQFSDDGKKIVTGSNEGATIWQTSTGSKLFKISGTIDVVRTVAFSPDGKKLVTGEDDDSTAKIWNATPGKQRPLVLKGHNDVIYSASFSPDGKKILTLSGDKTGKMWNTGSGKLICDFFVINGDQFIGIPTGYYRTTPAAAKLLHYVSKDLKVITFEQLDVKYNRPDKVLEALGSTDTALIKSYRKAWEKRIKKLGFNPTAFRDGYNVPEADFVNKESIDYEQKTEKLKLQINGHDSIYKLDRFNVWVNEVPVFGQRGKSIVETNSNRFDDTITINLSRGKNLIESSITNVNGAESYRMPLEVNYTPAVKQKEMVRFVGIGIDKFADSSYNLQFTVKDIRDLSLKLKEKYGDDILIDTLFNEHVTVSNVKAMKANLLKTTENDKVIIAYSGHGMLNRDYDYYLSTYSVNFDKPEENGLSYDELENLLDSIPARKKLMLIDACNSGEVDKDELVRINQVADSLKLIKGLKPVAYKTESRLGLKNSFELMQSLFVNVGKSTGATIISAAAGTQFALERNDLKNGVFTFSILEAMKDHPTIKLSELKKIVGERVVQLTNGLQKPTSRNETIAVDWSVW